MMKEKEIELQDRIAFLEEIFEYTPTGVMVIDDNGVVIKMNRKNEQVARLKRKEVLGNYYHDIWKELLTGTAHGKGYRRMLQKRQPFSAVEHNIESPHHDKKISGLILGQPLPSGGFILTHELVEEIGQNKIVIERMADELRRTNTFLTNLLNSSPNAVVTTDATNIILTANNTADRMFGYEGSTIVGKNITSLFMKFPIADKSDRKKKLQSGIDVECKKQNGSLFPARMQVSTFSDELFLP